MAKAFRKFLLVYLPLALLGLIAVGLVLAALSGAMFLAYSGIMVGPLAAFAVAHAVRRYRHRRDLTVLSYVEQSVRLNLPLTRMLPAMQRSESGHTARMLGNINSDLEAGMVGIGLSEALRANLRSLPAEVHAAITTGEMAGCPGRQLTHVLAQQRDVVRNQQAKEPLAIIYPLMVLLSLIMTLGLVSTFILPKYQYIYEDFDMQVPALTTFIFNIGLSLGPVFMAIGGLFILLVCIWAMLTLANLDMMAVFRTRPARRLAWWLPVLHGIERDHSMASLYDLLADAIENGHDFPTALGLAQSLDLNPVLQSRVIRWRKSIEAGSSIEDAAARAAFPAMVVSMLRTGQSTAQLSDVFRFLARYHRARFSRTADAIRAMILPLMIVLLAAVIGVFVVGVFMPLPGLIESISISAL